MRKLLFLVGVLLCISPQLISQSDTVIHENFDGSTISLTASPSSSWEIDPVYSTSSPYSYLGIVPNRIGDSTFLTTPAYDFYRDGNAYNYVLLQFKHICKLSPQDMAWVEYKISRQGWQPLPANTYLGGSTNYLSSNFYFNAASYSQWQAEDSLAIPASDWWKEELFDVSSIVGMDDDVQFRFVIKHGAVDFTQISYGWLLDDFKIMAAKYEMKSPIIELIPPYVKDTVSNTGPYVINARVKTQTAASINIPYLKYIYTLDGLSKTDSVFMTNVSGDSLWRATLPQFLIGTEVLYFIVGRDTTGNSAVDSSKYFIKKPMKSSVKTISIQNGSAVSTTMPLSLGSILTSYSYTQQIYLSSEIGSPGNITSLAFNCASVSSPVSLPIDIYLGHTTRNTIGSVNNAIPSSDLTLVYSGTYTFSSAGWNEITLNSPFLYNGTDNLVIAVDKNSGSLIKGLSFYAEKMTNMMLIHYSGSTDIIPSSLGLTASTNTDERPHIQLGFLEEKDNDTVAVTLTSIDFPVIGQVSGNVLTPIIVSFRNKGDSTLTSTVINWNLNGVLQSPYTWNGILAPDFETQDTVDYYTPRPEQYDTIIMWATMPNGVDDALLFGDTLSISTYGCSSNLSGPFIIGAGERFPTVEKALAVLRACPINGDITLALKNGEYAESWDLSNSVDFMGEHTLTITSVTGNANDVTLLTDAIGIRLGESKNIVIDAITIDASTASGANISGIRFYDACTNIVIKNCNILGSLTTSTSTNVPIYKTDGTGIVDSIFIINNTIDGGYYGFSFYGGTPSIYGTNIVFDSNTITNPYRYGTNVQSVDFISKSYNTVISSGTRNVTDWRGFNLYSCNGNIIGNRVIQQIPMLTPTGFYIQNHNIHSTPNKGFIANNEIILQSGSGLGIGLGDCYGLYISNSFLDVLYNSIYISGPRIARGMFITNPNPNNILSIKNNNIIMDFSTAYPIYINAASDLIYYDIDGNNMFAPQYVGNIGGSNMETPNEWKDRVNTDNGAISIYPGFAGDSTKSLKLKDYTSLKCEYMPDIINYDIEGMPRIGITTMGCYNGIEPYSVNATLTAISGWRTGLVSGGSDTIKVVLLNIGTTVIDTVVINWSLNNTSQMPYMWTGSLASGKQDTVTLGTTTYISGENDLMVCISGLGSLIDESSDDDTIRVSGEICLSPLSQNTYLVGDNGVYPDINKAIKQIKSCTASGDIRLELESGLHPVETINLVGISNAMNGNTLTITSSTGNKEDVVLQTNTVGFLLSESDNIIIKDITVDATQGTHAIKFAGACTNVVIRDCSLLLDSISSLTATAPIYKEEATEVANNIFIINNLLSGGDYGFYFYGGTGISSLGSKIIFDSNIIINQYSNAITLNYADLGSLSCNTILSRQNGTINSSWTGLSATYLNGPIIGNRVIQRSNSITSPIAIKASQHNAGIAPQSQIANNEIILNAEGDGKGIYVTNSYSDISHNSIFISGSGTGQGMYIEDNRINLHIKNNNIVMTQNASYPISFITSNPLNPVNLTLYDVDYNNIYAPTYVGFIGFRSSNGGITTMPEWTQKVITDLHSKQILPDFIDNSSNLELSDYEDLQCPPISNINTDIKGAVRTVITTMGCYHNDLYSINGVLKEVYGCREGFVLGRKDSIKVILENHGATSLTTADIKWSFNETVQTTHWSGNLAIGETDTIVLGEVTYLSGGYTITAWLENLGTLQDQFTGDDTVSISGFVCISTLEGIYQVGPTAYFKTINEAIKGISICGVSQDITLELQPGIYTENVDLTDISLFMKPYKLTITSATQNANDVVVKSETSIFTLSESNNIVIDAITIDARQGNYAIRLAGPCTNVVISNCKLLAGQKEASAGIYKETNTGIVDSIFIINNVLDGGYYGIRFYGGIVTAIIGGTYIYGNNVTIDNNIISNSIYSGLSLVYMNYTSVSHNTILGNAVFDQVNSSTWTGIHTNYTNGPITNNKIQSKAEFNTLIGINTLFHNIYNSSDVGMIANNEIIFISTGNNIYGINTTGSHLNVLHNSIYISNTNIARGITIKDNNLSGQTSSVRTRNNNIALESMSGYPVYFEDILNFQLHDVDYNNLYAPSYWGYASGAIVNITDWQHTITSDQHSKQIRPNFIDSSTSLRLVDYSDLQCPLYPSVKTDITGNHRTGTTTIGAYTSIPSFDMIIEKITSPETEIASKQTVPVIVKVVNNGDVKSINSATFGWSLNGIFQSSSTWIAPNPLEFNQTTNVFIDSFDAVGFNTFNIVVWIEHVNGSKDSVVWNDTISMLASVVPLARFATPVVKEVVNTLSFDVYTKILEGTGATINIPEMTILTTMNETVFYDTIQMNHQNDLWVAHIPEQYYGSKVIYSLSVEDTVGNAITITDSTYIQYIWGGEQYPAPNLSIISIDGLVSDTMLCSPDYTSIKVELANTGGYDYDFSTDPVNVNLRTTTPEPFFLDTVLTTGTLLSGEITTIELTDLFPIMVAGQYDIRVWVDSPLDAVDYDDTLLSYYISGRFGLPIDENFSNGIPIEFDIKTNNRPYAWKTIGQGTGNDTVIKPVFGTGMLSFTGTPGTISTVTTRQLDLSRTIKPTLSFWYFHDTVPSKDYTDVSISVDGNSYQTRLSIRKYDPSYYGWKQYTDSLPAYAINQCVLLSFEAMEKSLDGKVTQYIDRIRIDAKQDIAITNIFPSDLSACNLQNKAWNVVLSNLADPVLSYDNNPIEVVLELVGTSRVFTRSLQQGVLGRFSSDTIALTPNLDFTPGKYDVKAYFTSVLDDNPLNDTLTTSIVINPDFNIRIHNISNDLNPMQANIGMKQEVTIKNNGNMPLPQIDLVLTVDADGISPAYHFTTTESTSNTLAPGDSVTIPFNTPYTTPWSPEYRVHVLAYLNCDPTFISEEDAITEYVNMDNLAFISIDKPLGQIDTVGSTIAIEARLENKSDVTSFSNVAIHARIEDSKGNTIADIPGTISEIIGTLDTISYTFSSPYTVPDDSVYYITVCIDKQAKDIYQQDDTIQTKRTTDYKVGIKHMEPLKISMEQNIPNPAKNSTIISYSIPESGDVTFHIHNVNGQLLYNKVVQSDGGTNTIEINTSTLSAGIYFYSMEFNGQKITKQMNIKR